MAGKTMAIKKDTKEKIESVKVKLNKKKIEAKLGHAPASIYVNGNRLVVHEDERNVSAEFAELLKSEGLI
jgi:hypothetical protein